MSDDILLGDVITTRKAHPCGSSEWTVIRTGADIKIIYYIPVSSFSVVTSMVDDWINYTAKKAFYSVLAKEDFESRFEADLQAHTANIKEEIESRGK